MSVKQRYLEKKAELDALQTLIKRKQEQIELVETSLSVKKGALDLARRCAEKCSEAKVFFEELITEALRQVHDDSIEFKYAEVRDKSGALKGVARQIEKEGKLYEDPSEDLGDGVNATSGIWSQIGAVSLHPTLPKIVIFDEPGGAIDSKAWKKNMALMYDYGVRFGMQFIMTTHQNMTEGKVYEVVTEDGIAKVIEHETNSN